MPYASHEARRKCRQRYYQKVKADPKRLARRYVVQKQSMQRMKQDPRRMLLYSAKSRAPKLGVECTIELDDITVPETCPVFTDIVLTWGRGDGLRGAKDSSATLDRVDSSRGYVPGNVRVISWRANRLKTDATLSELRALVSYMENHDRKEYPA